MQQFEFQAECIIKEAFPTITFEEMEHWTVFEFMRHLARAEWVLINLRSIPIMQNDETPAEDTILDDKQYAKQLAMQGIDPMLALYVPPDYRVQTEPAINGIEWRGTV